MGHNLSTFVEFCTMTCRVLVCDDQPEVAEEWLNEIRDALPRETYELLPVPGNEEIKSAIQVLLQRRSALRSGQAYSDDRCLFDDADVLVIDYDLLHVDDTNTRHTGEGVARLARVFAKCGVVVVLNQYLEAQFDLSLRGHLESFADLNVDGDLIGCHGLWRAGPWQGFRPWHWPVLSDAAAKFKRRVAFLSHPDNLNAPILDTLKMTASNANRLSDTAFGFLAPDASSYDELARTTFADFIKGNSAAIDTRDGEAVVAREPESAARIAASRIAKWLEREVLGPLDVLVDIPHLLQRAPFLFDGNLENLDEWNAAALGERNRVKNLIPADAWFEATDWLNRPAVWWRQVEACEAVREARAKFDFSSAPDFVFLEDASRFGHLSEAKEFRAGFHNTFDRRFVCKFDKLRYAPQRRFAFGG
jgi:hypothetical protein